MSWLPKKSVVVPVDFTEACYGAVRQAREFVNDAAQVHVIHVLPKLNPMEPGVMWKDVDEETRAAHVEKAVREKLGTAGEGVDVRIGFGNAAHEITRIADEVGADLIVMPQRAHSRAYQVLVGSVAQRVIGLAHCPVLVLRDSTAA